MRHNLKLFLSPFNTETPATTPCLGAAQHVHSHRFRSASVSLHDCFLHQDLRKSLHIDGVVNQDRRRQHKEVISNVPLLWTQSQNTSQYISPNHHSSPPHISSHTGSFWLILVSRPHFRHCGFLAKLWSPQLGQSQSPGLIGRPLGAILTCAGGAASSSSWLGLGAPQRRHLRGGHRRPKQPVRPSIPTDSNQGRHFVFRANCRSPQALQFQSPGLVLKVLPAAVVAEDPPWCVFVSFKIWIQVQDKCSDSTTTFHQKPRRSHSLEMPLNDATIMFSRKHFLHNLSRFYDTVVFNSVLNLFITCHMGIIKFIQIRT